jgi:hypothetical protein
MILYNLINFFLWFLGFNFQVIKSKTRTWLYWLCNQVVLVFYICFVLIRCVNILRFMIWMVIDSS